MTNQTVISFHVARTDNFSLLTAMLFSLSFLAILVAGASASNVIDLTPDNFDTIIGKGTPGLVEL